LYDADALGKIKHRLGQILKLRLPDIGIRHRFLLRPPAPTGGSQGHNPFPRIPSQGLKKNKNNSRMPWEKT
jgi:hypothetical protein